MKKYLIFVNVLVLSTVLINGDEKFNIHKFKMCYTPKHYILCTQHDIGIGRYYSVPDQDTYLKSLIDKFNEFRSWYAKEFEIGNMRFAKFNFGFQSLTNDTVTLVGNAEISCTKINQTLVTAQRVYSVADFSTSVKTVLNENSTNHVIFQNQLNALINQAINSTSLVKYNMNEFGCSYSFKPLVSRSVFMLRCIFYVDKETTAGEILSKVQCSNCTEAESCIRHKYPGLCVPSNSTEKYVRKLLNPEPDDSYAGASMVVYIKSYLCVTTVLIILCEILLINKI